jgi:hypothetical protein
MTMRWIWFVPLKVCGTLALVRRDLGVSSMFIWRPGSNSPMIDDHQFSSSFSLSRNSHGTGQDLMLVYVGDGPDQDDRFERSSSLEGFEYRRAEQRFAGQRARTADRS